MIKAKIIGTGSCIPEVNIPNDYFLNADFFEKDGTRIKKSNESTISNFQKITGIAERRYALPEQRASDLGFLAAKDALESSSTDKETLDYIIVAHNFGDIALHSNRVSMVPSLASRVKALLQITNPDCIAYDLPFGCPGWVEGVIHANYFIRSGDAKRCLVIGAETLSRVCDPHDRDSMIFSDGGGAVILEATHDDHGVIAHKTQTYATDCDLFLGTDASYSPFIADEKELFIKMNGRKVYEFALSYVPLAIKAALNKANVNIDEISKVLIHQANEKMDTAILERLYKLCDKDEVPTGIMPMTIGWLGNSSVATIPTMLDLILKGKLADQQINKGDNIILASVGAGMNINAVVYRL